jgi:putative spermidine/putrescine transport system permease protein
LPRKIWDGIQDNIDPAVAALATLLILVTVLAMVARMMFSRGSDKEAGS